MPYGFRRGVKDPGEFTFIDIAGLSGAGALGIVSALATDFQQKGEASALFTINRWIAWAGSFVGFDQPPMWSVFLGLLAIGAGSIFYFQPITRQGAFAQGFGLLAVIVTAVPADLAGALYGMDGPTLSRAGYVNETLAAPKITTAQDSGHAADVKVDVAQSGEGASIDGAPAYELRLRIDAPDGLPDDLGEAIEKGVLRGRLHNANTRETYNLFRNAGGALERVGDSLFITAGVPAEADSAELWIRIELNGYAIEEQSATVTLGRELNWRITLRPSSTPMFVQRLRKSYWF
ncbi:MAG: hypothetical protein GC152_07110 [Alphaproteobacteria bacterium]|nr:hypothetical protein [Alphaproteobacteria bacterium]